MKGICHRLDVMIQEGQFYFTSGMLINVLDPDGPSEMVVSVPLLLTSLLVTKTLTRTVYFATRMGDASVDFISE